MNQQIIPELLKLTDFNCSFIDGPIIIGSQLIAMGNDVKRKCDTIRVQHQDIFCQIKVISVRIK